MSTIHIKPENKGKFNATKERTGKTTEELTHSKNPLTRKRAIFAQNASRWKHEFGGDLNEESLLGNKIENYPSEYVFDSYLNQPDQYGFGSWIKNKAAPFVFDGAKAYSNLALGAVGIDPGYKYENKAFDKIGSVLNQAGKVGGQIAANIVAPGVGGAALGAVQQGVGAATAQPTDAQIEADALSEKQRLTQLAMSRMANGGYVNFGNSISNQLITPIAGSIQREKTQSEHDELGQKKVLSDLSGGRIEYGTGGNLKELSANWYLPKDTYSHGGSFDFMMANGGAVQPLIDDVDGSNMKSPSTNTNIYTGGNSDFTERRSGVQQPSEDTSIIKNGGLHENSPLGGVPIGNRALVEEGEVIYKDKSGKKYVFSNKIKI